jgi:hypothetical protein
VDKYNNVCVNYSFMRTILFIGFVLLSFIFSGCTGQTGGTSFLGDFGGGSPQKTDEDFREGVRALEFSFSDKAPASRLLPGQDTQAVIVLENKGAYDINSGYLVLTADKSVVQFGESQSRRFELQGLGVDSPVGEKKIMSFDFSVKELPQNSNVRDVQFFVQACYDYQTRVLEDVCIDADPYDLFPDSDACDVSDVVPGGTGGPVGVTKVESQFLARDETIEPQFIFTVSLLSQGLLYKSGQSSFFCTDGSHSNVESGVVSFSASLSDAPLSCDTSLLSLQQGVGTVVCKGPAIDSRRGSYMAPLTVELNYGFSTTKQKTVTVERR